jgi:hypothetical protein
MNTENQPLGGDEDDFSTADFGNDLNPPAAEPPADPPPADPAGDPASADGGPPAGGDHEGEDPEASSVPYGRFKEVNDAKKTLASQLAEREAEIAALKAAQAPPQPAAPAEPPADPIAQLGSQLDELYDQVESLRLEGETKEAAKVQRQIDGINQEILLEKSRRIAAQTNSVTKVAEQYNNYLDALESAFPELVKGTDAFDPAKVEDINVTAGAYEKAGMHPLDAIKKATKLVLGQTLEDRIASANKPAPAAPAAPATKPRDLNKAVDAANRQPPDMTTAGVNRDDTKIDVSRLSDEEFDKLPLSKQRELRGDFA